MKYLLYAFCFLFVSGTLNAQADQSFKEAKKQLKKYYLDQSNTDALSLAKTAIVEALADGSIAGDPLAWITKGKIFNELANEGFKLKTLDPAAVIEIPDAASQACDALMKAIGMTEKKADKRDALKTLSETENHLNNFGIFAYTDQDYASAFKNFSSSISLASFLGDAGESSRLSDAQLMDEQVLYAAVSGYYSDDVADEDVKPYLMKLYESGSEEPFVYEGLYGIASKAGDANALSFLEKGRAVAPDDSGLLFSEINHYLVAGELNVLTEKLEKAIEKEPENISVYNTTGNVYDQLAQQARKDGDNAGADGYQEKAMSYYDQALTKDANNFEANYGIGQMFYNKAADMVPALNKLGEDYTKPGIAKYDALKKEMDAMFGKALPYFQKAEAGNSSDLNTVIALKEIYARLNDIEKSEMYSKKYDELSAGK